MNTTTERETFIARLRATADLLDQHPEIPEPTVGTYGVYWHLYTWGHSDVRAVAATIRRVIGGKWDKGVDEGMGRMEFTSGEFKLTVERDVVCARKVVGTETVTLPAVEAQPERTIEREIVEWDCAPLLSDAPAEAVSA